MVGIWQDGSADKRRLIAHVSEPTNKVFIRHSQRSLQYFAEFRLSLRIDQGKLLEKSKEISNKKTDSSHWSLWI